MIRPINILFIGVVLASVIVFIPVYSEHGYRGGLLVTLLLSIHNMLRLFVIDGELSFLIDEAYGAPGRLFIPYSVPATVLYISAPMITFGFVLSFYKNAASARKYLSGYRKDMFVFSDLNEKSAALAESLRKTYPDGMLVFCGVRGRRRLAFRTGKESEKHLLFQGRHGAPSERSQQKSHIRMFLIGDDEAANADRSRSDIINMIRLRKRL